MDKTSQIWLKRIRSSNKPAYLLIVSVRPPRLAFEC